MPDATHTVSDHLLDRHDAWGVRRLFGISVRRCQRRDGRAQSCGRPVRVRSGRPRGARRPDATAHGKFAGAVGVCISTSGSGAIHLLNGLYDAKLDHQPVVPIVGQ